MAKQIKWGICGCSAIANDFIYALTILPPDNHKVVAVAARDLARAEEFRKSISSLSEAKAFGSYEELYKFDEIDIIYVANLNHQHKACVLGALNAGRHVLCEKPMGLNLNEVTEMIECARKNQRFLMEGLWSRFFPVYQTIQKKIKSHEMGVPVTIMANFGVKFNEVENKRVFEKDMGGGCSLDIGCYLVQLAMFVFDHAKVEKIVVSGRQFPGKGTDDCAFVTLHFSGNRYAQLNYSGSHNYDNGCSIFFEKEDDKPLQQRELRIADFLWAPTELEIRNRDGDKQNVEKMVFPLPEGSDGKGKYFHGAGFAYEANCVRNCLMDKKLECQVITHENSIQIAEIIQEIRTQLGV